MRTYAGVRRPSLGLQLAFALVALLLVVAVAPASAATHPVTNGTTWLTTDATTTAALGTAGIALEPVPPTKSKSLDAGARLKFNFPIGGGRIELASLTGTIRHGGGLRFAQEATGARLRLTKFWIKLNGPQDVTVTARVNGPGTRTAVLNVDLSPATVKQTGRWVDISSAPVTLTQAAADALNATFTTTPIFTNATVLGTVVVHMHVPPGTVGGSH